MSKNLTKLGRGGREMVEIPLGLRLVETFRRKNKAQNANAEILARIRCN
jgi:hypothetical protein